MARRVKQTNAQRRDSSYTALLDTGIEMLVESSRRSPFAALRIKDVCHAAGYTTGAFYLHWKTADDYYEALSAYLSQSDNRLLEQDLGNVERRARETSTEDPVAAVLDVAATDFRTLLENEHWEAMELFLATWGRSAEYRTRAVAGYRDVDRKTAQAYAPLLERLGREPRRPLTAEQIATLLQALLEGLGARHKVDPDVVDGVSLPNRDTDLYAIGAACLLAVVTREEDDDRDLVETLQDLLDHRSEHNSRAGLGKSYA